MQLSSIVHPATALVTASVGILTLWLAWMSLDWPLIGDATIFHFAVAQFFQGAVPYRDFIDMNMPLPFALHAAIVAIGGLGDFTFRIFDLGSMVIVAVLTAALVWPAGRTLALLAAFTTILAHLLQGPPAEGQRDDLMLIPVLAAALCTARAFEHPTGRLPLMVGVGVAGMVAALLKPTGILIVALPLLAGRFRGKDIVGIAAGVAVIGLITIAALAYIGALNAFVAMFREYMPVYTADRTGFVGMMVRLVQTVLRAGGLAVAAALGLWSVRSARERVLVGLVLFGLAHYFIQDKGYFYHRDAFFLGLTCLGAWSLSRIRPSFALMCLALLVVVVAGRTVRAVPRLQIPAADYMPMPASTAMQAELEARLPRGARVQMLDGDGSGGGFRAMANSGMRQATPHAYWMFLVVGKQAWRDAFIADLRANPPDAFLLTNMPLPLKQGFEAVDQWPALKSLLDCCYRLEVSQTVERPHNRWAPNDSVAWRIYVRRQMSEGAEQSR